MRIGTIHNRILVAFVFLVLVATVAIGIVTVIMGTRDARNRVVNQLESVATLKDAEVQTWVGGLQINLDIVLSGDQVWDHISALENNPAGSEAFISAYDALHNRFDWASEKMGLFEELFLMDQNGRVLISTAPAHENEKHSIYDYFIEGLKGYYLQQPSYSLSSAGMVVVVSRPVEGDKISGVLAGRASLKSLNNIMLERTGLGETGETYLVGSNYRLLTTSRSEGYQIPETYVRTEGTVNSIEDHKSGSGKYSSYTGNTVIGVYHWLPELKVALLAEQKESEALHPTYMALIVIGGVALAALIIAILASIVITRSITAPLADLADTATAIASGDLHRTARVERPDEVGTVAQAFNTMTQKLRELVSDLEQRTEQLRTVNEVGRSISSILQLNELFPYVANSLRETFKDNDIGIIIVDRHSGLLRLEASAGDYERYPDMDSVLQSSKGIVSRVSREGGPLLINDVANDPMYSGMTSLGNIQSELAVPIKISDRILGVLDIKTSQVNAFNQQDLFTAQTLADQLAIAIENAYLYQDRRDMAIQEERNRLARDLHDAVSQTLFSASLIAEVLPRLWERNPEEGRKRLEEVRQLTRGALAEMRTLLLELRPTALMEADLPHLLSQLAESIRARTQARVTVTAEGECMFPDEIKIAFYRIAQETLNNIAKHSEAKEVKVELVCQAGRVTLRIIDDGRGFDMDNLPSDSLGLGIMRERATDIGARLSIKSSIGHGSEITVEWENILEEEKL